MLAKDTGTLKNASLSRALALAVAGLALAPAHAVADGTLRVVKGGDRISGNGSPSAYTVGVSGAAFEYTADPAKAIDPGSTGWTASPAVTDVTGATSVSIAAGTYYVRERAVGSGFAAYGPVKALSYSPDSDAPVSPQPCER